MNIFSKTIENEHVRFSVSNYIDFWYRNIYMAEKYFSKIEKSISLKNEKFNLWHVRIHETIRSLR